MKVAATYGPALSTWHRKSPRDKTSRGERATGEHPFSRSKCRSSRPQYRSVTPVSKHGMERKPSKKWLSAMKQKEAMNERVKKESEIIWGRLDNPTADSPAYPESGMSDEAIVSAKRGAQCALESRACGATKLGAQYAIMNGVRSLKEKSAWKRIDFANTLMRGPAIYHSWPSCADRITRSKWWEDEGRNANDGVSLKYKCSGWILCLDICDHFPTSWRKWIL